MTRHADDRRVPRVLVLATVILMLSVTWASQATAASTSDINEQQIFTDTNAWRVANDRVELKSSPCLDTYAEKWAKVIADKGKLQHRSTASLRKILRKCSKSSIGENLAYGQPDGSAAVVAWSNSPGHNRNMLGENYRWTASAAHLQGDRWWYVQLVAK